MTSRSAKDPCPTASTPSSIGWREFITWWVDRVVALLVGRDHPLQHTRAPRDARVEDASCILSPRRRARADLGPVSTSRRWAIRSTHGAHGLVEGQALPCVREHLVQRAHLASMTRSRPAAARREARVRRSRSNLARVDQRTADWRPNIGSSCGQPHRRDGRYRREVRRRTAEPAPRRSARARPAGSRCAPAFQAAGRKLLVQVEEALVVGNALGGEHGACAPPRGSRSRARAVRLPAAKRGGISSAPRHSRVPDSPPRT